MNLKALDGSQAPAQPAPQSDHVGSVLDRKFEKEGVDAFSAQAAAVRRHEKIDGVQEEMKRELRNWGVGLLLIGIVSMALAQVFDPIWGGLLVILGVVTLIVRKRGMFIVIGIALILVGVMNILGTLIMMSAEEATPGWAIFGGFQIYWGIKEIIKFGKYRPEQPAPAEPPPLPT
jgi:hypothetical protein